MTHKCGEESKHNRLPYLALDVTLLLDSKEVSWSGLLNRFARLMKAADAQVHWGGAFPEILRTSRTLRYRVETKQAGKIVRSFCSLKGTYLLAIERVMHCQKWPVAKT